MKHKQPKIISSVGDKSSGSHQPDIGLAEIAVAFACLKPTTDELRKAIATSLGFDYQTGKPKLGSRLSVPVNPEHTELSSYNTDYTSEHLKSVDQFEDADNENISRVDSWKGSSDVAVFGDNRAQTLVQLAEFLTVESDETTLDITPLEATEIARHLQPLSHVPLLHEHWFAGVMFALLTTDEESQEIDVSLLEQQMTCGRPFVRIPFRRRPALRRGVQIVLDHSDSMQPFWRDQQLLLESLENWLGHSRVRSWTFDFDAFRSPEYHFNWFPPRPEGLCPNTPLLVVSDFGAGKDDCPGALMECRELLDLLAAAKGGGSRLLALVPLAKSQWPPRLRILMDHVVEWDRSTSPQTVRRSRGRVCD